MAADVDWCGLCSGTSNYHQLMKITQGVYSRMVVLNGKAAPIQLNITTSRNQSNLVPTL